MTDILFPPTLSSSKQYNVPPECARAGTPCMDAKTFNVNSLKVGILGVAVKRRQNLCAVRLISTLYLAAFFRASTARYFISEPFYQ